MIPHLEDHIVALSSAPGPGARAIVRLSGPGALACALKLFRASEPVQPGRRRFYAGHIYLHGVHAPLAADLHVWPGPRSYTAQDLCELHTVSAPPLIDLLIAELLNGGARAAQPGEFTLRAFLAGKLDLTRVEAVLGVIEARNRNELRVALSQLAGGVARPLKELRDDLLNLLADVEAGLDFAEEDIKFAGETELLNRVSKGLALVTLLGKQIDERA